MKYIKLYEEFINELADSSKIYDYKLNCTDAGDVKIWEAYFTSASGVKYVCTMIDADLYDKKNLKAYSDKITGGKLKPAKLKNIHLSDMCYYEMNFKTVDGTAFSELTGKGEMPSVVSTCFDVAREVCAQEGNPKLFGFHFEGTPKDGDTEKDATQRTRIYRYFISKLFTPDFVMYEDGNTTRVIRIR